jgi:hypothetical protein
MTRVGPQHHKKKAPLPIFISVADTVNELDHPRTHQVRNTDSINEC